MVAVGAGVAAHVHRDRDRAAPAVGRRAVGRVPRACPVLVGVDRSPPRHPGAACPARLVLVVVYLVGLQVLTVGVVVEFVGALGGGLVGEVEQSGGEVEVAGPVDDPDPGGGQLVDDRGAGSLLGAASRRRWARWSNPYPATARSSNAS